MADQDRHTPEGTEQGAVPDPHRGEPTPRRDPHTRDEPEADIVRPDQQEEIGPIGGLMHASAVEAAAVATGDPEAKAEAARLGVEGEGVEAAQVLSILLATIVTLALALVGIFFLVGTYTDAEREERNAVTLYPELREVQRVAAEMENYSRTDSLYRLPIGVAMSQVAEAYYAQQQGTDAVPAPDYFSTVYLDALREADGEARRYEPEALGYDSLSQIAEPVSGDSLSSEDGGATGDASTVPSADAEVPATETPVPAATETSVPPTDDEPEDR